MRNQIGTAFTTSRTYKITLSLVVPLFVYLFLVFFQPFGVNNYESGPINMELIWGLFPFIPVLASAVLFLEFVLRDRVLPNDLFSSFLIWVLLEFIFLGSTSFLYYNVMGNFHDWSMLSYFQHVLEMGSILIFPFLLVYLFFYLKQVETAYQEIRSVESKASGEDQTIHLSGDYKKDDIALPRNHIVFLKAEDNYVGLHYLQDEALKKYLIRSTLSKMQKVLEGSSIIRINRSYLVNLQHVESFKQDPSGQLILRLTGHEGEFSVANSRKKEVREQLKKKIGA